MENKETNVIKISFSIFLVIVILLVIVGFIAINLYANSIGKPNLISSIKGLGKEEKEISNKIENIDNSDVEINEEINYPETLGAIFDYSIDSINQSVSNKTSDITYTGEPRNSNPYEISVNRKNITINGITLSFETDIYHACVYPIEQGGIDMWVILLRDGTVKYTTDQGKTIKDGGNHIIDIFPITYKRATNDEMGSIMGSTILVANEYGALIDLRILDNNDDNEKEEINYPETLGPIFDYSIDSINQVVSNKTSDITYTGEPRNSNPYEISANRKNITINGKTLSFETEIYHACVYPIEQGGIDMWVILLRDGTVKYTTDQGKTIKDGGNHIIDIFSITYKRATNDEMGSIMGSTILIANEFGALIDLRILDNAN